MKILLCILLLSGTIALTGCGDGRDEFVLTNTNNNQIIAAPICADDAYAVSQNAVLTVNAANGVLTNDTPNGATLTFQAASAQGGAIAGNQDGSFTYSPPVNFNGVDSFTYTLGNSGGVVTCTVTITVNAVNGFFVDATNGNDTTGSFNGGLPFATVQAAVAAAPAGSDIVVRPGNYTGAVNLLNNQRLLGNGSGLVISPQGAVRPVFTGPIDMADGNTVDFIRVAGTNGDAIDGIGQNSGTITNCELADTVDGSLGRGVSAENISGTWVVSNNAISGTDGIGIDLRTQGVSVATVTVANNNISGGDLSALLFSVEGTSTMTAFATGNTVTGNNLVGGFAIESIVEMTSNLCLDAENNTNDGTYLLSNATTSTLNVEQLNTFTDPQPGGAGNTGTIFTDTGVGFSAPTNQADGFCTP